MSDPIVSVNWAKVGPILRAFTVTLVGIAIGLWHIRAAQGLPLFRNWTHIVTAVGGGIVVQALIEYTSAPPTKSNLRRRQLQNLIAGYAYGAGGTNLVESVEKIRLF